MKKLLFAMAITIITIIGLSSCGGNKGESGNASDSEQVSETPRSTELDYAGINALANKSELSSSDYDFLLDQAEILIGIAIEKGKNEYKRFFDNMTEEQMSATFVLGAGLKAAAKQGKLSDAQLKRYEELRAKDPTK